MREGTRNFIVGITSATALLGLSGLMMRFGELDAWLNPKYTVTLMSDEAAGLRPGGAIEFNGVPIGVVDRVWIQPDPDYPVHVSLLISQEIDVPVDAEPFSVTPIIGGSARLQLQAPVVRPGQATPMLAKDGTARITGPIRGGLLDAISKQLDARMEPINRALENFNTLSATYTDLGRNLNDLLATQSPEEIAGGAPPNIKTAVTKLNSALDDIHAALDLAKDWLGDEQIRADARTSVEKARTLIENATAAVEKYATLAESLQSDSQQMVHKLLPLADQLAATLEDVNRLTHAASRGEGTVGQLMTNPDLYNSLNDAALRLERTLVEVQLLIQKFKKEGVPINW